MDPLSLAEAVLVADAVAVVETVAAAVVGELMVTVSEAPAARSPKVQSSTPELMVQSALLSLQERPAPVGRVSVSVTPVAVASPVLVTTMVKVRVFPMPSVPSSGVTATVSSASGAALTTIEPLSLSDDAFVADAVAVVLMVLAAVVGEVRVTVSEAPAAMSP